MFTVCALSGCLHAVSVQICVCKVGVEVSRCVPPDGHCEGLRGAGAGTDDLASQPFGLKDVEECIAGGDGP